MQHRNRACCFHAGGTRPSDSPIKVGDENTELFTDQVGASTTIDNENVMKTPERFGSDRYSRLSFRKFTTDPRVITATPG